MARIEITDLKEDIAITEEELKHVKGGPAYMKLGDIKGEATDTRSSAIAFVGGWGSSMYQY